MGQLEKERRRRTKRANLKKIILGTVATAGVLSVALVAPQALGAMEKLGILPRKRQREFIRSSRDRLIAQGLLVRKEGSVSLTPKGERTLRLLEASDYSLTKPRRWDGKWRVLIFDIPEKRRRLRDQVRRTLASVGFVRLQDSVWIYPYDCEDSITLLKADFHIGTDMLYLIVDSLEGDVQYRRHFSLIR